MLNSGMVYLYVNGSVYTISEVREGETIIYLTPKSLGILNVTAYFTGTVENDVVYDEAKYSIFINVSPRPTEIELKSMNWVWVNDTHGRLKVGGKVLDEVLGKPVENGTVEVYVQKKVNGEWIYVAKATVVNGEFSYEGVVDPVKVKLVYVPATEIYTPSETVVDIDTLSATRFGGKTEVLTSSYLPILAVAIIILIIILMYVKIF